jgi:hypothetical protein
MDLAGKVDRRIQDVHGKAKAKSFKCERNFPVREKLALKGDLFLEKVDRALAP